MNRSRTLTAHLLALLAFLASVARAEERVEVERFDGTHVTGDLVRCDADRIVVRSDEKLLEFDTRDVVSVRRTDISPRRRPGEPPRTVVEIANGDRLAVRPLSADEDGVRVQWAYFDANPVEVPLETVRGIAWHLPRNRAIREDLLTSLRSYRGEGDRIESENGDAVLGEFRELVDDEISLAVAGTLTKVPVAGLRSLAFDPSLVSNPRTPPRHVLVQLVDGSRLTATSVVVEGGELLIDTVLGPRTRIVVPRTSLASLRFVGGRAADLSDREPVEFEQTPWFGPGRTWQRDRSVTGIPLRIDDQMYSKGIGVQGRSRLVYDLDPADRAFRAVVGVDESAGDRGSVQFVVRVDGRETLRTPIVRGRDEPLRIDPVDLSGAKRLELVVETADGGDVLDRANWCDALIVRD